MCYYFSFAPHIPERPHNHPLSPVGPASPSSPVGPSLPVSPLSPGFPVGPDGP